MSAIAAVVLGSFAACQADSEAVGRTRGSGLESSAAVSFDRGKGAIRVLVDGEFLTAFRFGREWDKPFLYPLRTASGTVVSRGYPLEPREGEESDHDWHRGIWYGHGDINGHDFWRELGRDRTGTIVLLSDPVLEPGKESGTIEAKLGFRSADGELHGTVIQRYAFSVAAPSVRIDAELTFRADQGKNLRFGDTEDGGFAMRLADEFRQDRGALLLNAGGLSGTENIWGRQARWVDYSAVVSGQPVGVAILDHPSNLRHPSRWHARGYSLCSANPFGLSDFTADARADGSHVVPRGDSMTLSYRVVIHEGDATAAEIEGWFGEFAAE